MKFFITKKKLIKSMAEELAYLQINADWWYYCFSSDIVHDSDGIVITKQDMSSKSMDDVTELRCICHKLGILSEVYQEAYKIYDFRNSGMKDFVPDKELIEKLQKEFCEPIKKKRPIM